MFKLITKFDNFNDFKKEMAAFINKSDADFITKKDLILTFGEDKFDNFNDFKKELITLINKSDADFITKKDLILIVNGASNVLCTEWKENSKYGWSKNTLVNSLVYGASLNDPEFKMVIVLPEPGEPWTVVSKRNDDWHAALSRNLNFALEELLEAEYSEEEYKARYHVNRAIRFLNRECPLKDSLDEMTTNITNITFEEHKKEENK